MSISSIIDLAVILIVLVSAGVSFFRGFVREILTIFGFIGGGLAAFFFGGKVAPLFEKWFGVEDGKPVEKLFNIIPYNIVAEICAYAGIFLAVFLVLQLISYFTSATIKAIGLGPVDRALGVVFGIARAVLLLGLVYAFVGGAIPDEYKKEVLGKSKSVVYLEFVADWLKGFMPDDGADKAKDKAAEKLGEELHDKASGLAEDSMKQIDILKGGVAKKIEEEKSKEDAPAYSPQERKNLNNLIENQSEPQPAPPSAQSPEPESSPSHE